MTSSGDEDSRVAPRNSGIQRVVLLFCLAGGVFGISAVALAQVVAIWRREEWIVALISAHYPALVCLPIATFVALVIVVLLEARYDDVKMDLFNGLFKFEGAAGPIILWVVCFLSIVMAIKLLW